MPEKTRQNQQIEVGRYLHFFKVKNSRGKSDRRCFLKPFFFAFKKTFFQSFRTNFLSLLYMITLAYKISHCLSANHNPGLRCVICTGVTLELHYTYTYLYLLNCNALSQSESSNFFMCIINLEICREGVRFSSSYHHNRILLSQEV